MGFDGASVPHPHRDAVFSDHHVLDGVLGRSDVDGVGGGVRDEEGDGGVDGGRGWEGVAAREALVPGPFAPQGAGGLDGFHAGLGRDAHYFAAGNLLFRFLFGGIIGLVWVIQKGVGESGELTGFWFLGRRTIRAVQDLN